MQMQIQALIARGAVGGEREVTEGSNTESNIEVAKPPVFNREVIRVGGFITAYRLYLGMRMREATVEEQIQQVLSYVQGELADIWKENILEDLEMKETEFGSVGEFLLELRKEFREGDKELVKVAELRRVE